MPRVVIVLVGLCALLALTFVGQSLTGHGPGVIYLSSEGGAAALCLAGAFARPRERLAWALIGLSCTLQVTGDSYWHFTYDHLATPAPSPNPSDAFYLGSFVAALSGVLRLIRDRLAPLRAPLVLDGAMAGLTSAAVLVVLFLGPAVASLGSSVVDIAYISADLIMLGVLAIVFTTGGWRPTHWAPLLVWGLGHIAVDAWFAYRYATGNEAPSWQLVGTPLALIGAAVGAWTAPVRRTRATNTIIVILMPGALALVDLGILLFAALGDASPVAACLAAAALLVAALRSALTLLEHHRLLAATRRDALTDALTGLANRRRMVADLDLAAAQAAEGLPATLLYFDLDGFKAYNDHAGHAAGDALLSRLGARLRDAVGEHGVAYRPGGDEFCVLLTVPAGAVAPLRERARAALTEAAIGPSVGAVSLPEETTDAGVALRLADARMYASKRERRADAVAA